MDLSPYRNMEEPTQQGRNQRKVLTLSPTLFSNDVPWAKGATILFLSSIVPIRTRGLVRFVLLYYAILCLRSWSCWAKGSCIGAAVKGRFPLSIEEQATFPTILAYYWLIGIWPMLKVACLPSHPLEKLVARKKRRGSEAVYEAKLLPL